MQFHHLDDTIFSYEPKELRSNGSSISLGLTLLSTPHPRPTQTRIPSHTKMPKSTALRPIGLIIPPIGSHKCPSMVSKIPFIGLIIAPVQSQLNLTSVLFTPASYPGSTLAANTIISPPPAEAMTATPFPKLAISLFVSTRSQTGIEQDDFSDPVLVQASRQSSAHT